jgi:hypothetical protein
MANGNETQLAAPHAPFVLQRVVVNAPSLFEGDFKQASSVFEVFFQNRIVHHSCLHFFTSFVYPRRTPIYYRK